MVFDLPGSRPFAERVIRRQGLEERISFAGGDFEQDPLPAGFDVVWLSQILHGCAGPAAAAALVAKADASLVPGGRLFIQEFVLSDDRSGPLHPALFGLNMLVAALVTAMFIVGEGKRLKMRGLWLPLLTTVLVGVSCGLPLFLYLRRQTLDRGLTAEDSQAVHTKTVK
jgi:SAM-dependent methyltransferase